MSSTAYRSFEQMRREKLGLHPKEFEKVFTPKLPLEARLSTHRELVRYFEAGLNWDNWNVASQITVPLLREAFHHREISRPGVPRPLVANRV